MTESENQVENSLEDAASETAASSNTAAEEVVEAVASAEESMEATADTSDADSVEEAVSDGETSGNEGAPVAFDALELDPDEPNPDEVSPAAAKVEALNREIQAMREKLEDTNAQYLRITADFENFRKRTRKEQEEQGDKIKCSTILELLPVIDNFERARVQLKPEGEAAVSIHKSYQGIYKQLVDCLKRIGVSPMRAEGQEFDPMLHEAVMREPTEEHPDGTVIEELQRGYLLGERVLRHAMVRVAVAPDPVSTSDESSEEA